MWGVMVRVISGWHCVGPTLVLVLLSAPERGTVRIVLCVAAIGAQFVFDGASAVVRSWALGASAREVLSSMRWTFGIDALLSMIGLAIVDASSSVFARLVNLVAPIGLIRLLAGDRRKAVDTSVLLGQEVLSARVEAETDGMTGLLNRRGWVRALDEAEAAVASGEVRSVAVLLADLDGLKKVNDELGHEAGDALICAFATRLTASSPRRTSVARLGGDEFAVVLVGGSVADFDDTLDQLRALRAVGPSASLGVAAFPPAPSLAEACRIADKAVYIDKGQRRVERRA
jgi:diguanylate cyclase (GGDEF)-like protein